MSTSPALPASPAFSLPASADGPTTAPSAPSFILTLSCPDQPGIVHAVSALLHGAGANITEAAQFGDRESGRFFMRVRFAQAAPAEPAALQDLLSERFAPLAERFEMQWRLVPAERPMRTVILVSRQGHCLNDLLFRQQSGLLPIDIRAIVSNHTDFAPLAAAYGLPFHHIPVTADTKAEAERQLLALVAREQAEFVVLARYMQVLSDAFCREVEGKVINIHHSFLPSFKGARPYAQAHARGVKLIGATAHYVTADLDEGPIVEQSVMRVDHTQDAQALAALGHEVECSVLARAVLWHAQSRVLPNGARTVVFR